MQGMTDEGEESLELVAQMEALYRKLGITVYKSDGTMKNTYELLQSLSEIYQDLTAAEKAYVTETIAGKYQAQNAAAILNNFETAIKATETALNSEGSALAENNKVLDSFAGKINAFKSAFEELSKTVVNGDFVKGVISLGTTILNFVNTDLGQLVTKSAVLTLGLNLLGKAIFAVVSNFAKLKLAFSGGANFFKNYWQHLDMAVKKGKLLDLSQRANVQSLRLTKAEMKALGISIVGVNSKKKAQIAINKALQASTIALNLALGAASLVVQLVASKFQEAKQAEADAAQQMLDDAEDLNTQLSSLTETINRVEDLRRVTDDSSSSYAEAAGAREELNKIQQQLIKDYGLESDSIDLVNGSLEEQIKKLKELKKQAAEDYLTNHRTEYRTANDEIYGKNKHTRDINFTYIHDKNVEDILKKYGEYYVGGNDWTGKGLKWKTNNVDSSKKGLEEWKKYLQENEKELINSGKYTQEEFDNTWDYITKELADIEKDFGKFYDNLTAYHKQMLTAKGFDFFADDLKNMSKETVLTEANVKNLLNQYPGLEDALTKSGKTIKDIIKEYQNYDLVVDQIGETLGDEYTQDVLKMVASNDLSASSFEKLLKKYPELQKQLDKYGISVSQYSNTIAGLIEQQLDWSVALQKFNSEVDNLQSVFGTLTAAQNEYNEHGYITIDTLQSLLALDGKYLDELITEEGQLRLNAGAFEALVRAKIADLKATEEDRHYNEVLNISKTKLNNTTQKSIGWFQTLWNVIRGGKTNVETTRKTLAELEKQIEATGDAALIKALQEENKLHNDRITLLNLAEANISKSLKQGYGSTYKNTSTSTSSSKEWWEIELEKLKDQFKYNEITIETYINDLDNLLGRVEKGTEAWRKINEELQKQRLTKVEDDYKRGTISLDEYIKKLKELIKAYKEGSDAWNELADKIKKALQEKAEGQKDDYETAEDAAIGIIDEELQKLEDLKNAQEEYYDKLIEDKEKANEETERELELARLQEALANAQKEKTKRVWREGIGWVWEADQEAIRDAQEALDEFNNQDSINALEKQKEDAISAIEEQINAWEEYKKSWEDVADDYETQQARMTLAQTLGADAEAQILNKRLDVLEKYKNEYLAIMQEIANLENTSSDKLNGYNTPTDTNVNTGVSTAAVAVATVESPKKTYTVKKGDTLSAIGKKYGMSWQKIYNANKSVIGGNPNLIKTGQVLTIPGYSSGGIVDYTGLAMLHGSKTKPEFVFNNDQMRTLLSNITRPQTSSNFKSSGEKIVNYNFGNIELPNVSNAKQFVTELKSLVNITKHQ